MMAALAEARLAAAAGEVPVGAVVIRNGAVLARAHNLVETTHDPTAHAEILAIRAAAKTLGMPRLVDCDLYVTLEPCAMCAGAISFARIRKLVFAADDPKGGAVLHGPQFFAQPTCHWRPEIEQDQAHAEAAAAMLKDFFRSRRKK